MSPGGNGLRGRIEMEITEIRSKQSVAELYGHPSNEKVIVIEGSHAASYAAKSARVQVIAAYPITPQTAVVEELSKMCACGDLQAKFVKVESEHSAMACCIGAAATGARSFTATSSQGLALMHELLHWAAAARLPIVMVNVNRALAPPWSIYADHNDSLSQRDTGWMQVYCESNQEVYDTVLQAFKVSEKVLLPCMVNLDAFFLSHTTEPVAIAKQDLVDEFLPALKMPYKLDTSDPRAFGGLVRPDVYTEYRYKMHEDMEKAKRLFKEVDSDFAERFGRSYSGLIEEYRCEDAEIVIVIAGTAASTSRIVVDTYRDKGMKIGLAKMRIFRPFPTDEIRGIARRVKKIAVVDRDISFGSTGIFFSEVKAAIYREAFKPAIFGFVAGIGGRDMTPKVISEIVDFTLEHEMPEEDTIWIGLKR
jgi:pyruvate/2-oxoacid:ferredoxin oxidoreductase alpha subunit